MVIVAERLGIQAAIEPRPEVGDIAHRVVGQLLVEDGQVVADACERRVGQPSVAVITRAITVERVARQRAQRRAGDRAPGAVGPAVAHRVQ